MNEPPGPIALFHSLAPLENTSYILSSELRIVRVNAAWTRFAERNGGHAMLAHWGRGSYVLEAITQELRGVYRDLFARALAGHEPLYHDYECSSDQVYRMFRMVIFPLGSQFIGVTHSLRIERSHDRTASPPSDVYEHDGLVRMCAHCRRVRPRGAVEQWDWVPAYVHAQPPNVSHGLCSPCVEFYFPADAP